MSVGEEFRNVLAGWFCSFFSIIVGRVDFFLLSVSDHFTVMSLTSSICYCISSELKFGVPDYKSPKMGCSFLRAGHSHLSPHPNLQIKL